MNDDAAAMARPRWVYALLAFCAFMTFVYTPWDLFFKPVAEDQEVWFGFVLRGWAAKATEPLHGIIYAAFTWGLWKMRPWMRLWGTVYAAQVAVAMVVWGLTDERGSVGAAVGSGILFTAMTIQYWRLAAVFQQPESVPRQAE